MALVTRARGPQRVPGNTNTGLFSVILRLTDAEVERLAALPVMDGDLTAAFMTVDFAPRLVRHDGNELGIDYIGSSTTSAEDVGELCRLAVESKLGQATR